ncbi:MULTISPECIES: methyl-accepting chemotaxis protein [Asticcacaulis]|uniref:methyl-accepting chemotaxis protein n=1 Tax=Asticcacaulis TaxID=76890 RepID=UPI001AE40D04|nr:MULTISPECIES: methyl-accepting chemotaxis protein [Asticcacaulis]MBP2157671.1 methyl-accepting chemotaxis protein [Asticcacaulis solisilvae]MDR6798716.1 methyl-accepting chemotaxis protein [Asticcacaulis sp. BE141]
MGRKTADSNPQADIVFAAMDGLASPVAVAGADGIVYCNPAFATALNGRRDQYAGRALSSLYAPRQPEGGSGFDTARAVDDGIGRSGKWSGVVGLSRADGSAFEALANITTIMSAGKSYTVAQFQNQQQGGLQSRKQEFDALASTLQSEVGAAVDAISKAAGNLGGVVTSLIHSADETSRQSESVVTVNTATANNVSGVADAANELATSIDAIGAQVGRSTLIARDAVGQASNTQVIVNRLVGAAERIGDVIKLIQSIASQTNLLALNATIEAARAGDAGRGFAVVASEVKSLASQTAKATEEISLQIADIQAATTETESAIRAIGSTIEQINEISGVIADTVERQSGVTQRISQNVSLASQGTDQVTQSLMTVADVARETSGAVNKVQSSIGQVSEHTDSLQTRIQGFIERLRKAA